MTTSLNLSLTDELKTFITENSGDGSLYATPSEFVRDILREKKQNIEASQLRDSIINGFQDVVSGNTRSFSGDLRADLSKYKKHHAKNK
jgi:antitoxin ParD1/3/4